MPTYSAAYHDAAIDGLTRLAELMGYRSRAASSGQSEMSAMGASLVPMDPTPRRGRRRGTSGARGSSKKSNTTTSKKESRIYTVHGDGHADCELGPLVRTGMRRKAS
jgi:hypothetical protein